MYYGWVLVVTFLTIGTVVYGVRYSFGVFFKPLEGEFELTRAVIDEIEKKTHLKVVNSRETADTILYGNLVAYRLIPTVETEDDVVTQYRLIVTLDLKWVDRKTDKALFTDPVFSENAYAALEAGETLRDARREAFSEVAEKVIDRMEMRW